MGLHNHNCSADGGLGVVLIMFVDLCIEIALVIIGIVALCLKVAKNGSLAKLSKVVIGLFLTMILLLCLSVFFSDWVKTLNVIIVLSCLVI